MKNFLFFLLCSLLTEFSIAQNANGLFKKADSLYRLKDFKNAAIAFADGIKLQGKNAEIRRYWSAAGSWSLANLPDSAFRLLNIIAKSDKVTMRETRNIEADKDLSALQTDKRWKPLFAVMQKQAQLNRFPQEEFVYGRKDGMGLLMTQVKPKVKSNGKAIINVLAASWFSSFGWVEGSVDYSRMYLDKGYTVFLVVIGSQPRFAIPDQIADIKRAVRYIRFNAKKLGIDPNRIGIEGASAGGHLSLAVAMADEKIDATSQDSVDRVSSRVQAVAVLFPPTDFYNWGATGLNLINNKNILLQNRVFGAFDFRVWNNATRTYDHVTDSIARNKIVTEISPIYAVTPDDPPVMIIHGTADITVPIQQSKTFITKLKEAGVVNNFIIKKDGRHNPFDMEPELNQFVDWFDKYLK